MTTENSFQRQKAAQLHHICQVVPPIIQAIDDNVFIKKSAPNKWSKKEILGHLIDSATNNHHRIIRAQYQEVPAISYDQDQWNRLGHYQKMDSGELIRLWVNYNSFLAHLIKQLPDASLQRQCHTGEEKPLTLAGLIEDYIVHMNHHLRQILGEDTPAQVSQANVF